jgi:hypothetical protein
MNKIIKMTDLSDLEKYFTILSSIPSYEHEQKIDGKI